MIRLTRIDYDGNKKPIIIDAESIESIEDGEKRTELTTKRGWTFYVVESRDEVARKVLEWRLAMVRFQDSQRVAVEKAILFGFVIMRKVILENLPDWRNKGDE